MNNRGFTLIELTVSIVIVMLLVLISMVAWRSISARSRVEDTQRQIISFLKEARERTLARVGGTSWGVHFETNQATLFPNASFVAGLASSTVYVVPGGARITSWSLSGGGAVVLFQSLSGATNQDGVVTLQQVNDATVEKKLRVSPSGYVEGL